MAMLITHEGGLIEFDDPAGVHVATEQWELEGHALNVKIRAEVENLYGTAIRWKPCARCGPVFFRFWSFVETTAGKRTPCYLEVEN